MKYIKTFEQTLITKLNLSDKGLTSLPELPDSLKELSCSKNNLTTLPELPDSLEKLDCWNNNLTSLPELPDSLKELYCSENNLPYNNLDEYKEWVINNKKLIDEYGWIKAHEIFYKMKKYNL